MRRTGRWAAAVLAGGLLLGACSAADVEDVTDASPPDLDTYVALGDSFTAGPLIPETDIADGCFRSDGNYPALVAERLDIDEIVDVSCSGADTRDLTGRQDTAGGQATVPPQLRAVRPETDLVTLGIGGNDFGLFHTLVSTCSQLRQQDPVGSPCADELDRRGVDLVARTADIGDRVEEAVREIQRRAPEATVVLVGYLRLAPTEGRCPDLSFAREDYELGREVAESLNAALARAARSTGVEFADMHSASEDHDVCSDEPWVNGRHTVQGEAIAFHPFASGMEAVADEVVEAVTG
jgi:lysophospholipase L1-like esterase